MDLYFSIDLFRCHYFFSINPMSIPNIMCFSLSMEIGKGTYRKFCVSQIVLEKLRSLPERTEDSLRLYTTTRGKMAHCRAGKQRARQNAERSTIYQLNNHLWKKGTSG